VGFKAGVGVVIVIGQLKSVLGVSVTSKTTIGTLLELPGLVHQAQGATILVAIFGVAILLGLPKLWPKIAAPLVWVPLSIAASAVLGLEAFGVKLVGAVPSGLPSLAMPDLSLTGELWPAALGIALMSFTESVATARTFCNRDDPPISANRELLALGAANMASAFAGGMPVGGGASQTAVSEQAGVRSQMAQWVNAVAVLLVIMVLAPVISLLPKAALAALILVTAASMVKFDAFVAIAKIRRMELLWAFATVAGVIFIGTLEGILIAVVISILTLFYQANHPPVYAVAYNQDKQVFRRVGENDSDQTFPGLLILRTEGRLTFANAANARDKMQVLIEQTQPRVLVLECSAIPDIEYSALMMLVEAEENLRKRGITLWLAAVNPDLLKILQGSSLGMVLGRARMFFNLHKALEAWQQRAETVIAPPEGNGAEGDKHGD
jgi:sulfate permease, SulP family